MKTKQNKIEKAADVMEAVSFGGMCSSIIKLTCDLIAIWM